MAGKPPGFFDKLLAPIREGAIGRAFHMDTITEAQKKRDPSLQDDAIVRFGEALPHPDAPGVVHGVTSFASGMTTSDNALIMAGTGGLGTIETAIGKQGLSKLISLGFSAQMISDGIQSGPQFARQVQAGDWVGASETMTMVALSGYMAKQGIAHAMHNPVSVDDRFRILKDQAQPPPPPILSGKDIGTGSAGEPPKSQATWRKGEETYEEFKKRKAATKAAPTPAAPTPPPAPARATASTPKATPEQLSELEKLRKENAKLKGPETKAAVAKSKSEVKPVPPPPPETKPAAVAKQNDKKPVDATSPASISTPLDVAQMGGPRNAPVKMAETVAPVAETKPAQPETPTQPGQSILPAHLAGAKPRYSYGKKQFDLDFSSDLDKARYIAARPNRSKADQAYVDFVKKQTGLDEEAIRQQGNDIRNVIKSMAKDSEPGTLKVPEGKWGTTGIKVTQPETTAEPAKEEPKQVEAKAEETAVAKSEKPATPVAEPGVLKVPQGKWGTKDLEVTPPVESEDDKDYAKALDVYRDRLENASIADRALRVNTPLGPSPAIPVGGSRIRGGLDVSTENPETAKQIIKEIESSGRDKDFPNLRIESHKQTGFPDLYSVVWGENASSVRDYKQAGREYGYSEKAISQFPYNKPHQIEAPKPTETLSEKELADRQEVEHLRKVKTKDGLPGPAVDRSTITEKPPIKPDEPKLNLRQKLTPEDIKKAADQRELERLRKKNERLKADAIERSVKPAEAAPAAPVEPAREVKPPATAAPAQPAVKARPEIVSLVNDAFSTGEKNGLDKLKITPVDAANKPAGPPIEMDLKIAPAEEVNRVASELASHKGRISIEPLGDAPWLGENPLKKWYKEIPGEAKPAEAGEVTPARGEVSQSKPTPEMFTDLVSTMPIRGIKKGNTFTYMGPVPGERGGHSLVNLRGEVVIVSDEDFLRGFSEPGSPVRDRSGERGSASLGAMTGGLSEAFKRDRGTVENPRTNYKPYLAAKSVYNRNLSQTEKASPAVFEEMIRAGSSKSQWSALMHSAMPAINAALREGGGPSPEVFREVMTQDSLIGKQDRWIKNARKVDTDTDAELLKSLQDGGFGALEMLTGKLKIQFGSEFETLGTDPTQDLADSAVALVADKDFATLRKFLKAVYTKAADSVTDVMPIDEYEKHFDNPGFQKGLEVYKKRIVPFMAETHARNEGVMSNAPGPSGVYYPLIPIDPPVKPAVNGSGAPASKPKNPSNYFATGISENGYDTSKDAFNKKGIRDTWLNNKAVAIQKSVDSGLLKQHVPGDPRETYEWMNNGVPEIHKAATIQNSVARIIIKDGKVTHVGAGEYIGPSWYIKEIRPIFEKPNIDQDEYNSIVKWINIFSAKGIGEPIAHSFNITGSIVCNTPFLGPSLTDKAISQPFIKLYGAIFKIASQNPTSEEFSNSLMEASKVGGVPNRFGDVTFSRQYAEDTGARLDRPHWPPIPAREGTPSPLVGGKPHGTPGESKLGALTGFSLAPTLYGPGGIDARARVLRYDLAKQLDPNASPARLFNIMNQLGNYTTAFQSDVERWAKGSGLMWWYTAGSTAIRSGVTANAGNTAEATEHMSTAEKVKTRLSQQWTGSAAVLGALSFVAYKAYRGKFPWDEGEPPARWNQIPLRDEDRYSEIGIALCGNGPEVCYVDFNYFNPVAAGRGVTGLGIRGAYNTYNLGGTGQQVFEGAFRDVVNTYAHPLEGPAMRELFTLGTTLLGQPKSMSITMGPGLYPLGPKNLTAGQKVVTNLKQMNPFYGGAIEKFGYGFQDERDVGNKWLNMVNGLAFPRFSAVNVEGQQKHLEQDARQEDKPQE